MKAGDFFSSLTSHKSFGYILLALNYILAAYLVITGIALLIEAAGMKSR